MRLAGAQKKPRHCCGPQKAVESSAVASDAGLQVVNTPSATQAPCTFVTDMMQLRLDIADAQAMFPGPVADNHFIVMSDMTACAALAVIAQRLQLDCQPLPGFHIKALAHELPSAIAPTSLQKSVPHLSYLDMLPWATIRDRLLQSITTINQAEFMTDMRIGSLRVWGTVPWDPIGWEISEDFAKKWWFLVDDGIIQTTNFWRSQRGEKPLALPMLQRQCGLRATS